MGNRMVSKSDTHAPSADLTQAQHKAIYHQLKKTRLFDERCRKLFKAGRLPGTYFSQVGQGAIGVGSATFLRRGGWGAAGALPWRFDCVSRITSCCRTSVRELRPTAHVMRL